MRKNKHKMCDIKNVSDQVQSGEEDDEDYRPHWEIHWKVRIYLNNFLWKCVVNKLILLSRVLMLGSIFKHW